MASAAHKVDISWDRRPAGVVVHVVFDNARRLNVLNPPALLDLTEAFVSLAREDDVRVVVFSGAGGKAFIGGADINHMVTMKSSEDGRAFITLIHKLCQAIRDCPVPVVCKMVATIRMFTDIGSITKAKIRQKPAPSMRAAFTSSSGKPA